MSRYVGDDYSVVIYIDSKSRQSTERKSRDNIIEQRDDMELVLVFCHYAISTIENRLRSIAIQSLSPRFIKGYRETRDVLLIHV